MPNQKSRKMVATEIEIGESRAKLSVVVERLEAVKKFEPGTSVGRDARAQSIDDLQNVFNITRGAIESLAIRLEVETVEFLAGIDTDVEPLFDGKGGGSAVRQAS